MSNIRKALLEELEEQREREAWLAALATALGTTKREVERAAFVALSDNEYRQLRSNRAGMSNTTIWGKFLNLLRPAKNPFTQP